MTKTLIASLLLLLLLSSATSVRADTPVPTATPTRTPQPTQTLAPIRPSPTSNMIYLRVTPTPLTINPSTYAIPIDLDAGPMADWAINMYRWINRDNLIDFIATAVTAFVGLAFMLKSMAKSTDDIE